MRLRLVEAGKLEYWSECPGNAIVAPVHIVIEVFALAPPRNRHIDCHSGLFPLEFAKSKAIYGCLSTISSIQYCPTVFIRRA
jgi:hypothetical protein